MRTFKLESYPVTVRRIHQDSGGVTQCNMPETRYTLICTEEYDDRWGMTISDTYPLIIQLTKEELNALEMVITGLAESE